MPAYDGRSIVNVAVTVHRAAGGDRSGVPPLAPPLSRGLDPFDGRRAEGPVVLLLVDGLGFGPLTHWAGSGSMRGQRWSALAHPITTVFPSTTTAALTSMSTGTPPGRHGLVGYRQYLPKFGVVADLLKMSPVGSPHRDQLIGPGWSPKDLSGAPTLFRRGLSATALTREVFRGTGFTRLLYDGAAFQGFGTGTDLADELAKILDRPRAPRAVFGYWDELDTIQHLKGPNERLIDLELERFALLLEHVAAAVRPARARRTTVIITGDHGQVPASTASRLRVDLWPEVVREMARPLAGDRRAGFFAARPGRIGALKVALRRRLPAGSKIVEMDAACRAGLFGPPPFHPELPERLGDLLALVPSPAGLTYFPPGAATDGRHLFGAHGGMETAELVVPLVVGRLAEFAPAAAPRGRQR
jgi:hypothetical protein